MSKCNVPPVGWECSREAGHSGPCAASPIDPVHRYVVDSDWGENPGDGMHGCMTRHRRGDYVLFEDYERMKNKLTRGKLLTLEEVIAETAAYFDAGNGNPILREPMLKYMTDKNEVPHAVLVSLGLERVVAYRKKEAENGQD